MPLVRIEMREGQSAETKCALLEAVHRALVEAFGIAGNDRRQRLVQYPPESFEVPPGRSRDSIVVSIDAFPGRSLTAKRKLYADIVRRFGESGVAPLDVLIVLNEIPLENWGIRGGVPASEVDLGGSLDV